MSNWPYHTVRRAHRPGPTFRVQDRFAEADLLELRRLYRRAGAPSPPDEASIRLLLAESDLALALRPARGGPILAFARVLTDFARDAVILDALGESGGPISADLLRARVVSAAVSHPLLREVSRITVLPAHEASGGLGARPRVADTEIGGRLLELVTRR